MVLLANSLTSPGIGLVFWSVLIFGLFFLLLAKFAWKPILSAVKARDIRDKLIAEAKGKASDEAEKLVEKARTGIEREKAIALSEIKEQVANLSVEIASKILGEKLKQTGEHKKLIDSYLKEVDLNKN